jgi:hypothetical protein
MEEMMPPAENVTEVQTVPMAEAERQWHLDIDCPVQRERDLIDGLRAAVKHFGPLDALAKVFEIIRGVEPQPGAGDADESPCVHVPTGQIESIYASLHAAAAFVGAKLVLDLGEDADNPVGEEVWADFVERHEERLRKMLRMN